MRFCFQSVVRLCVSSFFHKLLFQKWKDTPPFRGAGWSLRRSEEWRSPSAKWKVKSEKWKIKVSFVSGGRRVKSLCRLRRSEKWIVKNLSYIQVRCLYLTRKSQILLFRTRITQIGRILFFEHLKTQNNRKHSSWWLTWRSGLLEINVLSNARNYWKLVFKIPFII